jgi:hypothetical protein
MHKTNSITSKNTKGSIRCFPTVPKDNGKPNYLAKVIGEDRKFARIFWLSRDGKLLKPSDEKTWNEWPKSCNPMPIEQDLPENLIGAAIKIFGQIGAAIQAGQTISAFIEREEAEKLKAAKNLKTFNNIGKNKPKSAHKSRPIKKVVFKAKEVVISPEEQERINRNLELFANIAKKKTIAEAAEIKKQNLAGIRDLRKKGKERKKNQPVEMKVENRGGRTPATVITFTEPEAPKKKFKGQKGGEKILHENFSNKSMNVLASLKYSLTQA